jgi:hypothetical protein
MAGEMAKNKLAKNTTGRLKPFFNRNNPKMRNIPKNTGTIRNVLSSISASFLRETVREGIRVK